MPPTKATSSSITTTFSWWQCMGRSFESRAALMRVPRTSCSRLSRTEDRRGANTGTGAPAHNSTRTSTDSAASPSSSRSSSGGSSRSRANSGVMHHPAISTLRRASRIPCSSAGKYAAPSMSTSIALPARGGGSAAAHIRPSSGGVRCAERPSLRSRRAWWALVKRSIAFPVARSETPMRSIAIASDHTTPNPGISARQFDGPSLGSTGRRCSALFVDLLAAFLEEAADRAGEPGDHGNRVDLHKHVEDSSSERDRVLDLRGNRQQLSRRPEHSASERVDLSLLGVTLEQETRDRTEHVHPGGRDGDRDENVPQPPMRRGRPTKNISKFAGSRTKRWKRHFSIVANTPDVPASTTGRIDSAAASSLGGGGSDENKLRPRNSTEIWPV